MLSMIIGRRKKTRIYAGFFMILMLLDCNLVPTARLELAQLSPLPPQDSVSTNFTTSALSLAL